MAKSCDLAWAAGLFEGEGTITVSGGRRRLSLKMVAEESVRRFAEVVDGTVYGPYRYPSWDEYPRSPFWVWVADLDQADQAVTLLFPLVSEWRRVAMYELFSDVVGEAPPHLNVRVAAAGERT